MSVFYPIMGIDVVAPMMAIDKVYKIYTLGPVPSEMFEQRKGSVEKTMNYITQLIMYGSNAFDRPEEVVEFFPDIGEKLSAYNVRSKKLYLLKYRTHDNRTLMIHYYYDARITDKKLPFTEKVDYVFHKGFEMTDELRENLRDIVHSNTKLVGPNADLTLEWDVPDEVLDELDPIDTYDIRKDQDQYVYQVNIHDYL